MVWPWTSQPSGDAYDSLDASTKALLEKEAPKTATPSPSSTSDHAASTSQSPPSTYRERVGITNASPFAQPPLSSSSSSSTSSPPTNNVTVPPQSLFQDGRYAHLWANYTPSVEAPSPTQSQDQLQRLLESYGTRRAAVSRAALENCVEEHLAENECMGSGSLLQKMGGCLDESRRFTKCYTLQGRFLKAMGYMDFRLDGEPDGGQAKREMMQARADEIWQEVVRREDEEVRATKEGREAPSFPPLDLPWASLAKEGTSSSAVEEEKERSRQREEKLLAAFREEKRAVIREELDKLPESERELELSLRLAVAKSDAVYGDEVGKYYNQEREERRIRKEQGKSTLGDYLKWLGGWSQ